MTEEPLRLSPAVLEQLRTEVPGVSEQVVRAVIAAVPSYADPFRGRMGRIMTFVSSRATHGAAYRVG